MDYQEAQEKFGDFLVRRDLITDTDLLIALTEQRQTQKPIGKIAQERDLLNMSQIFAVLKSQAEKFYSPTPTSGDHLFGEVAIELGFLDQEQVNDLLKSQRASRLPLGDILVEAGILTRPQMEDELTAFRSLSTLDIL